MTKSTLTPDFNPQEGGELEAALIVELFAFACRQAFTGSLRLISEGQVTSVYFQGGHATRWYSQGGQGVIADAIDEHLPPEQSQLVRQHAAQFGVDELSAVVRLRLLPPGSLVRLHEDCMLEHLSGLSARPTTIRYNFEVNHDCFADIPGMSHPLEPVPLIVGVLLRLADAKLYREKLSGTKYNCVSLRDQSGPIPEGLSGLPRQIYLALRRQPESIETLRLRRVAPENAIICTIFALLATGSATVAVPQRAGSAAPPRTATARRAATEPSALDVQSGRLAGTYRSVATTPSSPPARNRLPSTTNLPQVSQQKAAVPGQHATSTSGVRAIFEEQAATIPPKSGLSEHAVESSSLEAWMRAVDEPARRSKALKIVEKAAAHFPKNPRILFYLGCLNALTDRPLKAERAMLRVLQLDPDHSEARRELEKLRRQGQERRRNSLFGRWGSRRSG